MPDPGDIVITGMGMRCGVGDHALQSCASVRAGINRYAAWKAFGGGGEDAPPLAASFVNPALGDDAWINKAGALLDNPLREMLWNAELVEFTAQTRIVAFVALPDSARAGTKAAELQDFLGHLKEEFKFPRSLISVTAVPGDHTAGAVALQQAIELLQQKKADVCILAGVDSLLHGPYLSWLHDQGRLKFGDASSGVIPGEAAACVTLESREHAQKRGARALARVAALALEKDGPLNLKVPSSGKALTLAILEVLGAAQNGASIHRVYTDLNGERWRFQEFALVNSRVSHQFARGWQLHHPADCVADIGAAWVPAALCFAAHAFQRRCAGPGDVLITAAADAGTRAALVVGPA